MKQAIVTGAICKSLSENNFSVAAVDLNLPIQKKLVISLITQNHTLQMLEMKNQ